LGKTYHINAELEALFSIKELREYILNIEGSFRQNRIFDGELMSLFFRMAFSGITIARPQSLRKLFVETIRRLKPVMR
jgi:hypothetical protein